MEDVPGTVQLDDEAPSPEVAAIRAQGSVKYDRTRRIILVPQPTDDPNDPLNWPIRKRDVVLLILSLDAMMATALSSILAANTLTLSLYFRKDFSQIALLTGYNLMGVGIAGIFVVPTARVWGKRHLYLFGTVLLIISSVWAGVSPTYGSLLGARIVQGFSIAPFEALLNATVGDLYFVHERGKRMALSNLALFGSAFFSPILVGRITHTIGWRWTFYFVAIFAAALLPLVFLFCPETTYRRERRYDTDISSAERPLRADGLDFQDAPTPMKQSLGEHAMNSTQRHSKKQTFKSSLALFNGRKSNEPFWKLLLRPFPLFLHPAILWSSLIQATLIAWTVFIGVVLAAIFLGPPLFYDEVKTGYLYTGAFVGSMIGFLIAGLLADSSAAWLAKKNQGRYEPEFRILLVIPQVILGCAGIFGFGITSTDVGRYGWFWPDFFFALVTAGMVIGAVAGSLYLVDAHREIAVEAFTTMLMIKNFLSFGMAWGAYGWLLKYGIKPTFVTIGLVQVLVSVTAIPMWVLGKKNRAWFARRRWLQKTGLW